jgi:hypothetical protein
MNAELASGNALRANVFRPALQADTPACHFVAPGTVQPMTK